MFGLFVEVLGYETLCFRIPAYSRFMTGDEENIYLRYWLYIYVIIYMNHIE